MDYLQYNVFSYFTKHPRHFEKRISCINSWNISLLCNSADGVEYVEKIFPHLDGTEQLVFPYFLGKYAEMPISERIYDLLFVADATKENQKLAENFASSGIQM